MCFKSYSNKLYWLINWFCLFPKTTLHFWRWFYFIHFTAVINFTVYTRHHSRNHFSWFFAVFFVLWVFISTHVPFHNLEVSFCSSPSQPESLIFPEYPRIPETNEIKTQTLQRKRRNKIGGVAAIAVSALSLTAPLNALLFEAPIASLGLAVFGLYLLCFKEWSSILVICLLFLMK